MTREITGVLLGVLLVFLTIIGCDIDSTSEPLLISEICGTYTANYNAGIREYITLNHDSMYVYYFMAKDSMVYCDTADWKLIYEGGEITRPRIILRNIRIRYPIEYFCYDDSPNAVTYAIQVDWSPYIKKVNGEIYIERCPTKKQKYVKVN